MDLPPHSPLREVHISLLAHKVRVPPADTLNLSQGVHNLAFAINVSVQETQNVLANKYQHVQKSGS